jgi:hypothetical protein
MQGKRLRQGQGHGDQQGQRIFDCVSCNLVPRSIGGPQQNPVMLGLGALYILFTVPLLLSPQRIFYSSNWSTPPASPCPPSPNTHRVLYNVQQRPSNALQLSYTPFKSPPTSSPTQDDPRRKPLGPPTTTSMTTFAAPSLTTLYE